MERKGRNASDEGGGGRAWIKRERELIEPRGNYELRWPRLIHFRFVAEISSACAYLSSSSSPAALVTVHDGRAPDTRVFHTPSPPPSFGFAPFPLRFSLCRALPFSLAEGNRQRKEEEKLPGKHARMAWNGSRYVEGVEGC